jgi:hypothetical protein
MAQTTTHVNACDASLWLDNAAGTPVDISGSSNSISMNFTRELGELVTYQQKFPVRLGCRKDFEATLRVVYSTAADEGMDVLKNWYFANDPGSRTLHVYIPDKNVGSDHYYGEVTIGSLSFNPDPSDPSPIPVEANLMSDGEITLTTAAT